jgi:hypothetical protein
MFIVNSMNKTNSCNHFVFSFSKLMYSRLKFEIFLFFSLLQINFFFLVFLDYFDALISKLIFKK